MLEIVCVSKSYKTSLLDKHRIQVLDHISLEVSANNVAIIGESGSGKSTLCRVALGLEKSDSGSVVWQGKPVGKWKPKELYAKMQPVFQDNYGCFNPRWKVGRSLAEPMKNYNLVGRAEMRNKLQYILDLVKLPTATLGKYPHELSGGQQKRVCIARAISVAPQLIVLDEAVAGLDAPIMHSILLLLKDLQRQIGCFYLFVTHNIGAAFYLTERIAVMKNGRIIDYVINPKSEDDFNHPYSRKLVQKFFSERKK